jgi:hypothetical protein
VDEFGLSTGLKAPLNSCEIGRIWKAKSLSIDTGDVTGKYEVIFPADAKTIEDKNEGVAITPAQSDEYENNQLDPA